MSGRVARRARRRPPDLNEGIRNHYHQDLEHLADLLHELRLQDRTIAATVTNTLIDANLEQTEEVTDFGHAIATMTGSRLCACSAGVAIPVVEKLWIC